MLCQWQLNDWNPVSVALDRGRSLAMWVWTFTHIDLNVFSGVDDGVGSFTVVFLALWYIGITQKLYFVFYSLAIRCIYALNIERCKVLIVMLNTTNWVHQLSLFLPLYASTHFRVQRTQHVEIWVGSFAYLKMRLRFTAYFPVAYLINWREQMLPTRARTSHQHRFSSVACCTQPKYDRRACTFHRGPSIATNRRRGWFHRFRLANDCRRNSSRIFER